MTQEQKAKRFDEVIKAAREWSETKNGYYTPKELCEELFPELKESEDEKVREDLIELISYMHDDDPRKKAWLAWLERQSDTNETINRDEFAQDVLRGAAINLITWIDYNAAEGNMCLSNMECKDIENALVSGNWNKIYAYIKKKFEKQGERKSFDYENATIIKKDFAPEQVTCTQEIEVSNGNINALITEEIPINNAEPKFHEGEWIITPENKVLQITSIEGTCYIFNNELSYWGIHYCDKKCHLWTIDDAKDGDVLAANECYVIFKKIDGLNIKCYCTYHYMGFNPSFYVDTLQYKDAFHPATKEQCDTLFAKMREAGYEWDAEEKELKKLLS